MRIVGLPSNLGGSGFYRVLFPGREMQLRGHQLLQAPQLVKHEPGGMIRPYYGVWKRGPDGPYLAVDIFQWLEGVEFDLLLMNQRQERGWDDLVVRLRAQGKRVVVDSDDDWLRVPPANPASRKTPEDRANMLALLGEADGLTVATPALAELYEPYQENVRVVRNRIDWGMWADVEPVYELERRRLRVGWMGDAHWHKHDLTILRGVIGPWLQRHPDVEFVVAGDSTGTAHDLLGIPAGQRVSVMPTEFYDMDLADITAVMDVGLVPLMQGAFNNCKSHLKGLEYAACGIPCVATPTESYRWWVDEGENGLLARADKPREWRVALDAMYEGWREMGRNARLKAQEHTIQQSGAIDEWESVYLGDHADHPDPIGAAA